MKCHTARQFISINNIKIKKSKLNKENYIRTTAKQFKVYF